MFSPRLFIGFASFQNRQFTGSVNRTQEGNFHEFGAEKLSPCIWETRIWSREYKMMYPFESMEENGYIGNIYRTEFV